MSLDLIFSVRVFQAREPAALRQRFSRFEVLLWTLESYGTLPVDSAYLFVELATEFTSDFPRLRESATRNFGTRLRCLRSKRLASQREWREVMTSLIGDDDQRGQRLVWLMQNDDHPFIDIDSRVLLEGLRLLRAPSDSAAAATPYRTLQPTHWPEALQLSGKFGGATRTGSSYVASQQTLTDAVQVMTFAYLRYQTIELDWRGRNLTRLDSAVWGSGIYGDRRGAVLHTKERLQTMYVPLRELCRKVCPLPCYSLATSPDGSTDARRVCT